MDALDNRDELRALLGALCDPRAAAKFYSEAQRDYSDDDEE